MTRLAALLLLLLLAAPLLAVPRPAEAQSIDMSGSGPVDVTARDGFEWRENDQVVIANGDARAVRNNVTVLADRLVARYRKKTDPAAPPGAPAPPPTPQQASASGTPDDNGGNEVYRLEAHGHVRILTETDEAVGDDAVYDIDQAVLVMTGHALKLTTPNDVLTARDTMEYWSAKHMAVGRGNAVVVTTDGRRLSGDVLVAYTKPDTPQTASTSASQSAPAKPAAPPKPGADPLMSSGKLERVEAYGNVEARTAIDIVRGDRGLYLPDIDIARIVGHVKLTHYSQQSEGPAADVNMKTGIARMTSIGNDRVKGLIVPNDPADPNRAQGTPASPRPGAQAKPKAP
jgi:lipopolysaccharide export system protein LptA